MKKVGKDIKYEVKLRIKKRTATTKKRGTFRDAAKSDRTALRKNNEVKKVSRNEKNQENKWIKTMYCRNKKGALSDEITDELQRFAEYLNDLLKKDGQQTQ